MGELVRLAKEALRQQKGLVDQRPTIQAGARIIWQEANGQHREGVVDFFHTDDDGTLWAFCTGRTGWCAVNMKSARLVDPETPTSV